MQLIGKVENQYNLKFEIDQGSNESTGFSLAEKQVIFKLLVTQGLPVGGDQKYDYSLLKKEILASREA